MKKITYLAFALLFCLFCKTNMSFAADAEMRQPECTTEPTHWPSCINEKTDEPMDVVWIVPEIFYGYNPVINNVLAVTGTLDELAIPYKEMQNAIKGWGKKYVAIHKATFFVVMNDSLPGSKLIYSVERTEDDTVIPKLEDKTLFLQDLKAVFYVVFRPRKIGA